MICFLIYYFIESESVSRSVVPLCNPMDCSPPGSSVHEILQERTPQWVAISFSRGSSWPRDRTWVSHIVGRFYTLWATREAPLLFSVILTTYHTGQFCGLIWSKNLEQDLAHSECSMNQNMNQVLPRSLGSFHPAHMLPLPTHRRTTHYVWFIAFLIHLLHSWYAKKSWWR